MKAILVSTLQELAEDGFVYRFLYDEEYISLMLETGYTLEMAVYAELCGIFDQDEIDDITWCVLLKLEGKSTDNDDYLDETYEADPYEGGPI